MELVDLNSEMYVLSCLVSASSSPDYDDIISYAKRNLSHNSFYDPVHKHIYRSIHKVIEDTLSTFGKKVDFVSVMDDLQKNGVIDKVGLDKVKSILQCASDFSNYTGCVDKIKEMAFRRTVMEAGNELLKMGQDVKTPIERIIPTAKDIISGISDDSDDKVRIINPDEIYELRGEGVKRLMNSTPILTGFKNIDRKLVHGYTPGMISTVGGFRGVGKSAFKSNVVIHHCNSGYRVLLVTPEQGFQREMHRFDAIINEISIMDIVRMRTWDLSDERFEKMKNLARYIQNNWKLHIIESRNIWVSDIYKALIELESKGCHVDVVWVDLFDNLRDVQVGENKEAYISKAVNKLFNISEELNTHICLLTQFRKDVEEKKDKTPKMAYLKGSGVFAERSDWVVLLHRDKIFDSEIVSDVMEVHTTKQKDGSTYVARLDFIAENLKLVDSMEEE